MQTTPKVSVIVPSYNHGRYLARRLDSVLAQTFRDFELIVLDDCSTDNSRALIAEYQSRFPSMQVRLNEKNSGSPYFQWHAGIALARGAYVWVAESDDFAEPQFLEHLVPLLEGEEDVSVAMCRSCRITSDGSGIGYAPGDGDFKNDALFQSDFFMPGDLFVPQYLSAHSCIPNASAVLFRKARYLSCGGIDSSMRLSGDWLLWAKLLKGHSLSYTARVLNHFRVAQGESPRLSRQVGVVEEWASAFRWVRTHYALTPEQQTRALNHFARMWGEFFLRAVNRGQVLKAARSAKIALALSPSVPLRAGAALLRWCLQRIMSNGR